MFELIRAPYLGTAEEDMLLGEWLVEVGEAFKKGQTLATLETLKATFELEAEADGVLLRHLAEPGTRVAMHAALAASAASAEGVDEAALERFVAENSAEPEEEAAEEPEMPTAEPAASVSSASADAPAAPLARRLAAEHGLDLSRIAGTGRDGLIRAEDVEAVLAGGGTSSTTSNDGTLDEDFLGYLEREGEAFGALSSEFKVALYRKHGALLGKGVHIGAGTVLRVGKLVVGDGSRFGANCSVEAELLTAGELFYLGPRTNLRCRKVLIGDNAFFTSDIEIGGGGAMDPEAELVVGSHGFVGEFVHLNPCRTLTLEDEVVVSRNAVVMTHSFGGSVLAGFPNRFAPVTIGAGSQIGISCTLFPGVEMGAGSILLSGSSLVTSMPAGRLFGGVPATDLKAAARPLSPKQAADTARGEIREFARQLDLRGFTVGVEETDDALNVSVQHEGALHRIAFSSAPPSGDGGAAAEDIRVAMRYAEEDWEALGAEVVAIDLSVPAIRGALGPLAAALREFLRKRGVRLHPRSWTYPGGWL